MKGKQVETEWLTKNVRSPPTGESTVYEVGSALEVVTIQSPQANLSNYRRLSAQAYVDRTTGEVKTYRSKEQGQGNAGQFRRNFENLRRTVLANYTGSPSELHITLTVSQEHEATSSAVHEYFRRFWKRFSYRYPTCEYVTVAEPHENGRFHLHVLVFDASENSLYVPNEVICGLWEVGFTKTERIGDIDRLASYFCSEAKRQRWAKFYQRSRKLFRCSQGVNRPSGVKMSRKEVEEYVKQAGYQWISGYTCSIVQDCGDGTKRRLNTVTHERFSR